MITIPLLARFVATTRGQAHAEGERYAAAGRVGALVGSAESVTAVVRGREQDYEVVLWTEGGTLAHRCSCPSWRDPCKHEIAAALLLRRSLAAERRPAEARSAGRAAATRALEPGLTVVDPEAARRKAVDGRVWAASHEQLEVRAGEPPSVHVTGASGFSYRVTLRGDIPGPHGCDCPDFESNRLHTCKHVERARLWLAKRTGAATARLREAARRARVYLHFGEVIEPRLLGKPAGRGAALLRAEFDDRGVSRRPLARDERGTLAWLAPLGDAVEPEALAWLERRAARRPVLPAREFAKLLPALPLRPYAYQWEGAAFLARSGRALLADEMGLGKTVQAILAAVALRSASDPVKHVTVICPASLRGGWQDEIGRWLGEEATLLEGNAEQRAHTIGLRPTWLITHFEQVVRDHRAHAATPPDLLVIDEAQRAKGLRTRTARVLKTIGSRYVFALTGTPLENRLEDAYAIAQLIDQRLLPPLWQIERDHFVRDESGRKVVMYRNLDAMRSRLAPAFLRRRKEDVALELPERLRSVVVVPMHEDVRPTYDDAMGQVRRIASKRVILPADLDRMMRLLVIARRCCNGPHMLGRAVTDSEVPKLEELAQALRELCLGEGRKAVVFSEWTDMTDRVETMCRRLKLPVFHLRGDVPVKRRPELIRAFTATRGPAVFVSTDAGGVGLNLQAADVLINLDLPWNPARLEQRIARVHRIGSKRTVQVLVLVTAPSIEAYILGLHDTKKNVLDNIWAKEGEDRIAAPGGSGAFKAMVEELLRAEGKSAASATAAPERDAALPGATAAAGADPRAEPARAALDSPTLAPAPSIAAVDPVALATAIAAVAPALPAEHRLSLAEVLRALAAALDPA